MQGPTRRDVRLVRPPFDLPTLPMTDLDPDALCPEIRSILVERLGLEGVDPASIDDDAPFMEELGLDSVDALELVLGLEQRYDVQLVKQGLEREAFESIAKLAAFVVRRKGEAKSADGVA